MIELTPRLYEKLVLRDGTLFPNDTRIHYRYFANRFAVRKGGEVKEDLSSSDSRTSVLKPVKFRNYADIPLKQ